MTREERENAIDIIQSILDKYEEDECLVTEITIGDEDIKAFKMAIKALEQEPRWIPVSERLPEENKTVIASTKYGVYPEARYTKEDGWEWAYESGADYWVELEYVTAWMPLPESYKGESEDKE